LQLTGQRSIQSGVVAFWRPPWLRSYTPNGVPLPYFCGSATLEKGASLEIAGSLAEGDHQGELWEGCETVLELSAETCVSLKLDRAAFRDGS
jgi:hypothetical protein